MSFLQRELRWFWDELHWQKSPGSRKWELQIKQRRFVFSPSSCLQERRLGEGGRQETVKGCWTPFREASAFVCFVIAYLSECLLGLVKVKIRLFPFFLFLLKPFTQKEMNCVHSFYRDWCERIFKWSHEKSLDTCCVLCVPHRFSFNQWTDEHTYDMESQVFPWRFFGFLRDVKSLFLLCVLVAWAEHWPA